MYQLCQPTQKEKFNMPGLIDRSAPKATALVAPPTVESKPESKPDAPATSTSKPRGRPRKVVEPPVEGSGESVSAPTGKPKKKLDISKSKAY